MPHEPHPTRRVRPIGWHELPLEVGESLLVLRSFPLPERGKRIFEGNALAGGAWQCLRQNNTFPLNLISQLVTFLDPECSAHRLRDSRLRLTSELTFDHLAAPIENPDVRIFLTRCKRSRDWTSQTG